MRPRLEVTVARDRIAARVTRGRRTVWSGECELQELEGLPDTVLSLRRRDDFPKDCQEVRFCVAPPLVQIRTLKDLPPVRGPALRRVIEQQSNRFFRRRNSILTVDAKWQDRKSGLAHAGAIDAELGDLMRKAAAESRMRLADILAVTHNNEGRARILRFARNTRQTKRLVRIATGAILVSVWICGSYLAGYILDLELDRNRLARELDALRPELAVLGAARREIADVVRVVGTLEAREARRGWVTRLLARLARTIPESAHVVSVSATAESVTLELRARDVGSVVDSLAGDAVPIVMDGDVGVPAAGVDGDEWQAVTVRISGVTRVGS